MYVHQSCICISVKLSMMLRLQPWLDSLLETLGEGIKCLSTDIQASFQVLPPLQE